MIGHSNGMPDNGQVGYNAADAMERGEVNIVSQDSSGPTRTTLSIEVAMWCSMAILLMIVAGIVLSAFIARFQYIKLVHEDETTVASLSIAHEAIQNLAPLLLIIANVSYQHSRRVHWINMKLFVGMSILYLAAVVVSAVLASCKWLVWAHLALNLGYIWVLVIMLLYFQFVLRPLGH